MADQSGDTLVQERTLSVPLEDGTLHIQVLELGKQVSVPPVVTARRVLALCRPACLTELSLRQTLVWLGHDAPKFNSLVLATPTRFDTLPATSALLGSGEGSSLAQRLGAQASLCVSALLALVTGVKLMAAPVHTHSPEDRQGGAGKQQPACLLSAADGAPHDARRHMTQLQCRLTMHCPPRLLRRSTCCHCSQEETADSSGVIPFVRRVICFVSVCPTEARGRGCVCAHACVRSLARGSGGAIAPAAAMSLRRLPLPLPPGRRPAWEAGHKAAACAAGRCTFGARRSRSRQAPCRPPAPGAPRSSRSCPCVCSPPTRSGSGPRAPCPRTWPVRRRRSEGRRGDNPRERWPNARAPCL